MLLERTLELVPACYTRNSGLLIDSRLELNIPKVAKCNFEGSLRGASAHDVCCT
jgi:hypothetical protein